MKNYPFYRQKIMYHILHQHLVIKKEGDKILPTLF